MATLVQQPAVADTQVSQLRAVRREEVPDTGGLSNFILGILPTASKLIDDNQKANAQHNVMLGIEDELNGFTRDVSFIDRKYYNQGREIQAIEAFTSERTQTYQEAMIKQARDNPNATAEELLSTLEGSNLMAVDAIASADIDPSLREKMYESHTKARAAQVKTVADTIKMVGGEVERSSRGARTSSLMGQLMNVNNNAEQDLLNFESYLVKAQGMYERSGKDSEEAFKLAQNEASTVLEAIATNIELTIDNKPEQMQAINKLYDLVNTGISTGQLTPDTLVKVGTTLNNIETSIRRDNASQLDIEFINKAADITANSSTYTYGQYQSAITSLDAKLKANEITPQQYVSTAKQYLDLYETSNKALLDGKLTGEDIITQGITLTEFETNYGTASDYNKSVYSQLVNRFGGNNIGAANAIIDYSINGTVEDLKDLRKMGSELFWRQFTLKQSVGDFKNDPNGELKSQAYESIKSKYLAAKVNNPSLAADLLSGLDDRDRIAVENAFNRGGTLADAMVDSQKVEDIKTANETFQKMYSGLTTENLNLTAWTGVSVLGTTGILNRGTRLGGLFNETGSDIRKASLDKHTEYIKAVLRDSPELAPDWANVAPDSLRALLTKKGMIVQSTNGHQVSYFTNRMAQSMQSQLTGIKDESKPALLSRALDLKRQGVVAAIKADRGATVSLDQVNIRSVGSSTTRMVAEVINDKREVIAQYPITTNELGSLARGIHNTDVAKAKGDVKKFRASGYTSLGGVRGNPTSTDKHEFTLNTKGTFLSRTVTALDAKHKGQRSVVKFNNKWTIPFNGNQELATAWADHSVTHEGLFLDFQSVNDTTSGKPSRNAGVQTSLTQNPAWEKAFEHAKGNAQRTLDVQADFNAAHFKQLQAAARTVGIPVATQAAYPKQHMPTQIMIADMTYHYGEGGRQQAIKALNASNVSSGMNILKQSAPYKSSNNRRRAVLESALRGHFNNKAQR